MKGSGKIIIKKIKRTYALSYTPEFEEDLESHKKSGNKSVLLKIEKLLGELRNHPKTGTGKPEPLKGGLKGQWSRRITGKHRLIYEIDEEKIIVMAVSAYGHYDDK